MQLSTSFLTLHKNLVLEVTFVDLKTLINMKSLTKCSTLYSKLRFMEIIVCRIVVLLCSMLTFQVFFFFLIWVTVLIQ